MADEVTTDPAVSAAPAAEPAAPGPETTAAPAPEPSPEGTDPAAQKTEAEERKFSQAEVDAMMGKRLARERRSWEREAAQRPVPQPQAPIGEPTREQFASDDDYVEARAEWKAEQKVAQREAERMQREVLNAHAEREEKAREKFEDYDAVVRNQNLAISPLMADTIRQSETGPEVIYHLGQNPDEAQRIYNLPPFLQVKELGRLEAKLAAAPPVTRKTSSAPAPITPVRGNGTARTIDTTDPRSDKEMSDAEWIRQENERVRHRAEGRVH